MAPRPSGNPRSLQLELWVPDPDSARVFDRFREELRALPARSGVRLGVAANRTDAGGAGSATDRSPTRVTEWETGHRALLSWRPSGDGAAGPPIGIAVSCGPAQGGTLLSIVCRDGRGQGPAADSGELVRWIASEIVGPIARSLLPSSTVEGRSFRPARRPVA